MLIRLIRRVHSYGLMRPATLGVFALIACDVWRAFTAPGLA